MEQLSTNPIIEFNPNQLVEVRKTFGYEDLNRLHQDITLFEDWIKMQEHFMIKEYDKEYLERYLISNKGSIERAKKRLDKLCTLRGLMPEYLRGFDVENEFQQLFKTSYMGVSPKPTLENSRIVFYSLQNPDASCFQHMYLARCLILIFQYLYCNDYNSGIELIVDCRNLTFGIVSKMSPMVIANAMFVSTEGLGLRIRGLHFIFQLKIIDAFMLLVKQGLSEKLASRVHVHEREESLSKYFSKALLPKDLGGDLDTMESIKDKNFKEFSSPEFIKQLKYMENATTNESKRLCSKFNEQYSGMPGSFKVLTVD